MLLGDGSGTFASRTDYTAFASNGHPTDVVLGDFNGDGRPDIATANQQSGSNELAVFLNSGDGTYGTAIHVSAPINSAWGIGAADVNGDGKVDLVGPSQTEGVLILPGNGDGTFGTAIAYPGSGAAFDVVLSDLNGDGLLDVTFTASAGLSVMLGQSPVRVAGTAAEDQVLTASNTLADADGLGTISYQWQRDGVNIDRRRDRRDLHAGRCRRRPHHRRGGELHRRPWHGWRAWPVRRRRRWPTSTTRRPGR